VIFPRVPILSLILLMSLVLNLAQAGTCMLSMVEQSKTPVNETDEKEADGKEVLVQTSARHIPRPPQRLVKPSTVRLFGTSPTLRPDFVDCLYFAASAQLMVMRC
jgi:hypothetical protein